MEDSELTRKAIEELMNEMDEYKEKESIPMERKKNPLGRPNKLFLGRTINSMMTHNKRQSDRNLQRCERKLKELDAKQRKLKLRKHRRDHVKKDSSHEYISSDEEYTNKTSKNIKKKKRKRRKKKHGSIRSPSPSSTSSSDTTDCSSSSINSSIKCNNRNLKKDRHKTVKEEEYGQDCYPDYNNESTMRYYVDPNMAYAIMAYSQMNHMMQQQELVQQEIVKEELEESIEIPSDLSLSGRSSPESSLNISLHSSSAEEDENGILTFKLSSDDEEKSSQISQKLNKKSTAISTEQFPIDCDENDMDSVHSHISLDSKDSQSSIIKKTNEIYSLSSSCTNSEEIEIVKTSSNISELSESDGKSKSFQDKIKI